MPKFTAVAGSSSSSPNAPVPVVFDHHNAAFMKHEHRRAEPPKEAKPIVRVREVLPVNVFSTPEDEQQPLGDNYVRAGGRTGDHRDPLAARSMREEQMSQWQSQVTAEQREAAQRAARTGTSRSFAPSALYPAQARPAEPLREDRVKNIVDFEGVGRAIGPHGQANVLGGYLGMSMVGPDLNEKFTQRTYNDMRYAYYHPAGPHQSNRGNAAVNNLFKQHRMAYRGVDYKNTAGRYAGAFSEWIRPGHPMEEMWRSGAVDQQGHAPRQTMKADDVMVLRHRDAEAPNGEGRRMTYVDNYSSGYEQLINPRRVQHDVTREIDHNLLLPYNTNPYSQPIGIVPPR